MTAPGHTHVQTSIAGLVELALSSPTFTDLIDRAQTRPDTLAVVGPASARLFAAAALARTGPLLVVTATGREADDLTVELKAVLGDAVTLFPSWETLPHERLSPGVETVGARMMVLRRLARPDDEHLGLPLRVVVTTARSLLQPMVADLGEIEPVTLTVGAESDFDTTIARLVELAYTRVDMVAKRGEFAVSKSDSAPTVSVTGSISPRSATIGCSSERAVVTTTRSGSPRCSSSGRASLRSTIIRAPTVSTPGESRSCGSVSQDGNRVTASPKTALSSTVRSSASRPVAVTTSSGPVRARAAAANSRALAGPTTASVSGRVCARSIRSVKVGELSASSTSPAIEVWT